jgi:hypothetical protein
MFSDRMFLHRNGHQISKYTLKLAHDEDIVVRIIETFGEDESLQWLSRGTRFHV